MAVPVPGAVPGDGRGEDLFSAPLLALDLKTPFLFSVDIPFPFPQRGRRRLPILSTFPVFGRTWKPQIKVP